MRNIVTAIILMLGICTAQAQLIKEKAPVDPKYLAGAVPTVDGKVVFSKEIPFESKLSLDSIQHLLGKYIAQYLNNEDVLKRSSLVYDKTAHHLEVGVVEYMYFKRTIFVTDRTQIIYKLTFDLTPGKLNFKMDEISYYYNEEDSPEKFTAEEWITDDTALKRNKMDFVYKHGKFRIKTINLFDQYATDVERFIVKQ